MADCDKQGYLQIFSFPIVFTCFLCSMKFLERGLLLLGLIGYYLAVWNKPADYSVIFIACCGLAILYVVGMPFLLNEKEAAGRAPTPLKRRTPFISSLLFGIINAYCVFSITYHSLGQIDVQSLCLNSGLLLLLSGLFAIWQYRKTGGLIYRKMLTRTGIQALLLLTSIVLYACHPVLSPKTF